MTRQRYLLTRFSLTLALLMVAVGGFGCSDIEVTSRYGPEIKLSGLGPTYSWVPPSVSGTEARSFGNVEIERFVQNVLEQQLQAKGFQKVSEGAADFCINYRLAKKLETTIGAVSSGEVYEEGALILDVISPKTGKLIWRGVAKARINNANSPDVRKQRVEQAVRELFKVFPPK